MTEVNRVGNKVSAHSGRSTAKPDYHRHNYYVRGRGHPGLLLEAFFRLVKKRPQTSSDLQAEGGEEVKVTQISNNVDVEVRNMSEQSVEIIGGRLKQFASQWPCMTSDPFILNRQCETL